MIDMISGQPASLNLKVAEAQLGPLQREMPGTGEIVREANSMLMLMCHCESHLRLPSLPAGLKKGGSDTEEGSTAAECPKPEPGPGHTTGRHQQVGRHQHPAAVAG